MSSIATYNDSFLLTSGYDREFLSYSFLNLVIFGKIVIVIAGCIGLVIKKGKRELLLLLLAIIGIIFSLGVNYPFESLYSFLFEHIFLFKPFREVGKFRILYLLSLSFLVPNIFIFIRLNYKKFFWPAIILFTAFVIATNPAFNSGNFLNSIIPYNVPIKYKNLNEFLSSQKDDFRVAVYPNNGTMQDYTWFHDVRINPTFNSVFLSVVPLSKDLAISNKFWSDYQSRYLDVIEKNIQYKWAVERLGNARVKYLIVDLDLPGAEDTISLLDSNKAVKRIQGVTGFITYQILNYTNKEVTKHPAVYYFGDIDGMKYIPPEISLINLGIDKDGLNILKKQYTKTLVLYNSSTEDLFLTLLSDYNFSFFPDVRFTKNPVKGFYPANAGLYSFTQNGEMYYNKEIIQSTQKSSITKQFKVDPGTYRVFMSTISTKNQSNDILLTINEQQFHKKNFRKKETSQEWMNFGTVEIKKTTTDITVTNNEDASLFVDQLILIPEKKYNQLKTEYDSILKNYQILTVPNSEKQITSSSYMYVLSNTFSTFWNICDKKNMRVNFYANGSFCVNEMSIHPTFIPNTLYTFSLYTSWILFGGSIVTLFVLYKKR